MMIEKKKVFLGMAVSLTMMSMLPMMTYAQAASDGHTDHTHTAAPVIEAASDGHTDHTHGEAIVSGVGDGHTDHAHAEGGSDLLKPWSSRWFGLLAVSTLLTSGLSFLVWKYIRVNSPKKITPVSTETPK